MYNTILYIIIFRIFRRITAFGKFINFTHYTLLMNDNQNDEIEQTVQSLEMKVKVLEILFKEFQKEKEFQTEKIPQKTLIQVSLDMTFGRRIIDQLKPLKTKRQRLGFILGISFGLAITGFVIYLGNSYSHRIKNQEKEILRLILIIEQSKFDSSIKNKALHKLGFVAGFLAGTFLIFQAISRIYRIQFDTGPLLPGF